MVNFSQKTIKRINTLRHFALRKIAGKTTVMINVTLKDGNVIISNNKYGSYFRSCNFINTPAYKLLFTCSPKVNLEK